MKAVVFDMDGVIVDSEPWHDLACREIFSSFNATFDRKIVYEFHATGITEFWTHVREIYSFPASVEELSHRHVSGVLRAMENISDLQPIHGCRDLIVRSMEHGLSIALASSSPHELIDPVLSAVGLSDFFKVRVSASDVKKSKPSPEIYFLAAKKLGLDPSECVAIEDSRHGVMSAKAAGMKCIAVRFKGYHPHDLSSADRIVERFSDIHPAKLL